MQLGMVADGDGSAHGYPSYGGSGMGQSNVGNPPSQLMASAGPLMPC